MVHSDNGHWRRCRAGGFLVLELGINRILPEVQLNPRF